MAVGAVVALPVDEGNACLKRRFVVRVDVEIGAHVAGGLGGVDILDACDSRAVFESGMDGGQTRFACAYNDDVVLFRFGEVCDRLGCLQESGAGRCGGFGLFRGCFGLAASGEASGGKCAHSGNSGCLKEVAARYAKLFFHHYSLLAVGRGAAGLEFPRCLRWRPSSCRWTELCALEGFAASTDEAK